MCIDSAFTLVLNMIHLMSENIDDLSHTDVEMVLLTIVLTVPLIFRNRLTILICTTAHVTYVAIYYNYQGFIHDIFLGGNSVFV